MKIMTPEEARAAIIENRVDCYTRMISTAINRAVSNGDSYCEVEFERESYNSSIVNVILQNAGYEYITRDYAYDNNAPLAYFYDDEGECCTYTTVTVTIHWGR